MSVLTTVTQPKLSMDNQDLLNELDKMNKHGMGSTVTLTEQKVLKKVGRTSGMTIPSHLQNLRKLVYTVVSFHHNYQNGVQNRQVAQGSNAPAFKSAPASGMHPYTDNGVVWQADKNHEQLYMRYYFGFNGNAKTTVVFIDQNDMPVNVTSDEKEDFFTPKPSGTNYSPKQDAGGIKKEAQINVRAPKFESVYYVSKGKNTLYNNLNPTLMDLLDLE